MDSIQDSLKTLEKENPLSNVCLYKKNEICHQPFIFFFYVDFDVVGQQNIYCFSWQKVYKSFRRKLYITLQTAR